MSTVAGENLRNIHDTLIKYSPKFRSVKNGGFEGLGESKILPGINIRGFKDVLDRQIKNCQTLKSAASFARQAGNELANYCLADQQKFKDGYVIDENVLNKPEANDLLAYAASLIRMVYQCVAIESNVASKKKSSGGRMSFSEDENNEIRYFNKLAARLQLVVLEPMLKEFHTAMSKARVNETLMKTIINSLIRVVRDDKYCIDHQTFLVNEGFRPLTMDCLLKVLLRNIGFTIEEPASAAV